ncbi:hypothetical protein E2C01_096101 [Portunus trituberculatus]|uniref:Uncharacterized protein n=1 Tax=Portunus trituberculatus TaxID=210409 RepID=A0A5B7K5R8_PORTR|nr:hypothetical protein [Portunus trituberculatus]
MCESLVATWAGPVCWGRGGGENIDFPGEKRDSHKQVGAVLGRCSLHVSYKPWTLDWTGLETGHLGYVALWVRLLCN